MENVSDVQICNQVLLKLKLYPINLFFLIPSTHQCCFSVVSLYLATAKRNRKPNIKSLDQYNQPALRLRQAGTTSFLPKWRKAKQKVRRSLH